MTAVFNQRRSQQILAEGDNCRHQTKKGKKEFFAQKGNNKKKNDRKGTAPEVEVTDRRQWWKVTPLVYGTPGTTRISHHLLKYFI